VAIQLAHTQPTFIHPATHGVGQGDDAGSLPPMGLRLRLKSDVSLDKGAYSTPETAATLTAMRQYGVIVSGFGTDWSFFTAQDPRWETDAGASLLDSIASDFSGYITGDNFEAVYTGDPLPM